MREWGRRHLQCVERELIDLRIAGISVGMSGLCSIGLRTSEGDARIARALEAPLLSLSLFPCSRVLLERMLVVSLVALAAAAGASPVQQVVFAGGPGSPGASLPLFLALCDRAPG